VAVGQGLTLSQELGALLLLSTSHLEEEGGGGVAAAHLHMPASATTSTTPNKSKQGVGCAINSFQVQAACSVQRSALGRGGGLGGLDGLGLDP